MRWLVFAQAVLLSTMLVAAARAAPLKPGEKFRDCETCPEMIVLPAGSFLMGSPPKEPEREAAEGPQRRVAIVRPFAMSRFEITFNEWEACVADGGCKGSHGDSGWGRGRRPVIDISWHDANAYAAWLAKTTGKPYRLLSEAEWEYAARAGTATPFSTGRILTDKQANFDPSETYNGSRKGKYRQQTVPVGSFPANPFGLHDMHGNVWEWVQDCWNETYEGAPADGSARLTGDCTLRVLRGGGWGNIPSFQRSAMRYREVAKSGYYDMGIRIARDLE